MDITNRVLWIINIFGIEIWITQTIVNTWIIMAFLIVLCLLVRVTMRKWQEIPQGAQNFVELVVEAFDGMVKSSAGEKFTALGYWFFMAFAFILVANLSGIIGLRPPTADWATTFAFALATLIIIQIVGFKYRKGQYLKSFFQPIFLFFPLNVIGELSRPVALSFRLFGNVLAGMILTSLVYTAPNYLRIILPTVLHVYFDVFSGIIQTYIFCVLSLTFIGNAANTDQDQ